MTKQATYIPTNSTITVVAVNGGWTTIKFADGTEKKVRNGQLSEVVVGPDRRQSQPVKKETKVEAQTQETSKPTPPVRVAAPAHFVGEVAPGKQARIKDTRFDLSRYYISDTKTSTGRRTIDCADEVAAELRGLPIDEVYAKAAATLGMEESVLRSTYGHLNIGMQRMNLGNRIRGAARAEMTAAEKAEARAKREQEAAARAEQKQAEAAAKAEARAQKDAERAAKREAAEAEKLAKQEAREAAKKAKADEKAAARAAKQEAKAAA